MTLVGHKATTAFILLITFNNDFYKSYSVLIAESADNPIARLAGK